MRRTRRNDYSLVESKARNLIKLKEMYQAMQSEYRILKDELKDWKRAWT